MRLQMQFWGTSALLVHTMNVNIVCGGERKLALKWEMTEDPSC